MKHYVSVDSFFCFIWALRHFQQSSVIPRWCLNVAGSSMLTFRVLPHRNTMPQTLDKISQSVTLYWHWADLFWFLALLCVQTKERKIKKVLASYSTMRTWKNDLPHVKTFWLFPFCTLHWLRVLFLWKWKYIKSRLSDNVELYCCL